MSMRVTVCSFGSEDSSVRICCQKLQKARLSSSISRGGVGGRRLACGHLAISDGRRTRFEPTRDAFPSDAFVFASRLICISRTGSKCVDYEEGRITWMETDGGGKLMVSVRISSVGVVAMSSESKSQQTVQHMASNTIPIRIPARRVASIISWKLRNCSTRSNGNQVQDS